MSNPIFPLKLMDIVTKLYFIKDQPEYIAVNSPNDGNYRLMLFSASRKLTDITYGRYRFSFPHYDNGLLYVCDNTYFEVYSGDENKLISQRRVVDMSYTEQMELLVLLYEYMLEKRGFKITTA